MHGYVARRDLAQISRSMVSTTIRRLKKILHRLPKIKLPMLRLPCPIFVMPKWMCLARDDGGGDHVCGDHA